MFVRKKRSKAPRRKSKAKGVGKVRPRLHLPDGIGQRHLDLIGLFLIAAGVYLCFVLFFGWDGGEVGYGVETGLEYLVGEVGARIVTVLMVLAGGLIVTGTSISALVRGLGRGFGGFFSGSHGGAQNVGPRRRARPG